MPAEALRVERQDVAAVAGSRTAATKPAALNISNADDVAEPALLARLIDACETIEARLDGPQAAVQERCACPSSTDAMNDAQRTGRRHDEREHEGDLKPAVECHGSVT